LDAVETDFFPWILKCLLMNEGMELNYWPEYRKNKPPIRVCIPFGSFLVLRVDAVHGGIFGTNGNTRLHVTFIPLKSAITKKADQLNLREEKVHAEVLKRFWRLGASGDGHSTLGASGDGHSTFEQDLLLTRDEDNKREIDYYSCVEGFNMVNDCDRSYPLTFSDPTFNDRLI
jgi:hypothetical protein